MAIQVHIPLGQAAGSSSIWHDKYRAQVLHYFLVLHLWRVGSEARIIAVPPRLGVHPEVSGEHSSAA